MAMQTPHETLQSVSQSLLPSQSSPVEYPSEVKVDITHEIEIQVPHPSPDKSQRDRDEFFKAAMNLKWEKVHELFEDNKHVRLQKLTNGGNTVLHFAISCAEKKDVLLLLKIIKDLTVEEKDKILMKKNNRGNTPLHLAAALGRNHVCHYLACLKPEILRERNNDEETPLFSAVRHGKKATFVVLQDAINRMPNATETDNAIFCRRYDGENILHYAIRNGQFDLAHEIMTNYPGLVNQVNISGESALHTLANKPSVFKSGTRLGLFDTITYYCTITKPLKLKSIMKKIESKHSQLQMYEKKVPRHDLFCMTKKFFKGISLSIENREQRQESGSQIGDVAVSFFEIIAMLRFIFPGIIGRGQIRKLKQKHEDAKKVMEKLVDKSELWWVNEDTSGGMEPQSKSSEISFLESALPLDPNDSESQKEQTNQSKDNTLTNTDNTITSTAKNEGIVLKNILEKFCLEAKNVDNKILLRMEEKESSSAIDASPVLVAAKRGIKEMVEHILHNFPVAKFDRDKDGKTIVLLAVEHRQVHVYNLMLKDRRMKENLFGKFDNKGNSALHHAAMLSHSRPWSIPGAALQMQWEMKWYKYVKKTVHHDILTRPNKEGKLAQDIFTESHDALTKEGGQWLTNTSQSCSVVAALVATVAFATASQVPGGVNSESGAPVLAQKPVFQLFAISALIALCFSVTSLVMFLAILTSRYQARDFNRGLPVKLIVGLTCLFLSIASMLVSFCAGDFFVVDKHLKSAAYPIYAVMCFPVTIFAFAQFPLYIDLLNATLKRVPERTEKMQDD